ncbi:MAG: hypothetical protein K0R93_1187 [Anaerosolibacter sp.]|jgi:transglutaminase-like putative cysteine protease|uniref:transglutaminase-like domain-containing protein n=1 Tax=Anaerosolibacter sp. TaxID=1872527 RepID=UPI0026119D50|nr:transglutaminase-like domain-containing protein [Anaerosolibacter sp.]MDF2546289.1 hypothetical protein [Anaerosolibacter sp.]
MHPNKKSIIYFILGAIITASINLLMLEALNIHMPVIKIIILQLGVWIGVCLSLMFPRWVIPPIALGSACVLGISYYQGIFDAKVLWNFGKWAFEFIKGLDTNIILTYDLYLTIILFAMIDIITGFILLKFRNAYLLSLWSIFFIVEWYQYIDHAIRYFNIFIFGLVLFYAYESYEKYMKDSIEQKHVSNRFPFSHIAFYGILSLMLIMGTANIASIEFEAVSVQSINDTVISIFPSLREWRHNGENKGIQSGFAFEETPYQENGEKLGGAIQVDKSIVMYVSADRQLYLRGRIKSLYTGENWLAAQDKGAAFVQNDQGKEYKGITYKETKIEIYPTNIRTNTIFAPYKPYRVDVEGYEVLRTKEDELYIVKSFLRPRPKSYYVHSKAPMLKEVNFTGTSKSYKAEMREYLQLPDEMSPKIKALTEEVTDGYSNSYEKIKGIETYLRKTYLYTLHVSNVPQDKDFVEYFLYEEKKGYCTYFASAMAVMGRTIGVPTRYVEGFILPDVKNEDGYFEVTADRAHAWVEAYFDELGWIAFEPTPAYPVQSGEIHIESQQMVNTNTISSPQRQNPDYLAFKNRLDEEFAGLNVHGDYNKEKPLNAMKIPNIALKIVLGTIGVFILTILLRIGHCKIKMQRLHLMKENPRAVGYYYESIEALSRYLQSNEEEGLTPRERLESLEKYFNGNLNRQEIVGILEKGLYSGKPLSFQELEIMKNFEKKMEEVVRQKLGFRLFFYHKFVKGTLYTLEPQKAF